MEVEKDKSLKPQEKSSLIKPRPRNGEKVNNELLEIENIKIITFLAQYSDGSKKTYSRILKEFFFRWQNLSLKEIKSHHIEGFLYDYLEGLSKESLALYKSAISSFFFFLELDGYIDKSPARALKSIKIDRGKVLKKILEPDELEYYISRAETKRDELLFKFLYYSALRASEAISLRSTDFKIKGDQAVFSVVGKGDKTRLGAIPLWLYEEIISLDGFYEGAPLFRNLRRNRDQSINYNGLYDIFRRINKYSRLKKKVSPHKLRHTHATHAAKNKVNPKVLQNTLGHSSAQTTMVYIHAASEEHSGDFLIDIKDTHKKD